MENDSPSKSPIQTASKDGYGIVYVLTNPAMPGLVKIGMTSSHSVETRLVQLYSTGVPVPFDCEFAGRVKDGDATERALHIAFGPYRVNRRREFFEIEPEQAIALLEVMIVNDVTTELQAEAEAVDVNAEDGAKKLRGRRRPNTNFIDMGIPIGSTLEFTEGEHSCVVASGRQIFFEGENTFLSPLTMKLLKTDRQVQPSAYWEYNGRRLSAIYEETYAHLAHESGPAEDDGADQTEESEIDNTESRHRNESEPQLIESGD